MMAVSRGFGMGWQSDWLYELIFDEIATWWSKTNKEGKGELGPPPQYFLIQQCVTADSNGFVGCIDPVLTQWRFDNAGLQTMNATVGIPKQVLPKQGMFFEFGIVRF